MNLSRATKKIVTAMILTATVGLGAMAMAAPASAAAPKPEISVSAQTGAGTRAFVVTNEGNTVVPAGTQFTYKSNTLANVGLFGNKAIAQDWYIGALGSGNDVKVKLKDPLLPGQTERFDLAKVELSVFSQYSFKLSDPNTVSIDTNYNNNTAGVQCLVVFFGLPACSAS